MSPMRNKAVRKKVVTGQPEVSDTEKIRRISALYIVMFNSSESLIPQATELFHTLGEILEGTPLEELRLNTVDKTLFLQAYEDLTHD